MIVATFDVEVGTPHGQLGTAAVVATGEMGAAVARVLATGGLRIVTALNERSPRTVSLADAAGAIDVGTVAAAAEAADVFLSIVPPGQAWAMAEEVASSLRTNHRELLFLDCNAVSPATASRIGTTLVAAGVRFVDAGIIGFPPSPGPQSTRFYVSGPNAEQALELGRYGLDLRLIGPEVGQASTLKMCYGALTKGLTALGVLSLTTAARRGLTHQLMGELELSQPALLAWLEGMLTSSPPKSYRWIAEMEEIAVTFDSTDLGKEVFLGVADVYRALAESGPGRETPETRRKRSLSQLGGDLAAQLPPVSRPAWTPESGL
jgi:3-hydroxyisobutyrate dehydrogenase-like beta-hydroxyacid dehydrogenase